MAGVAYIACAGRGAGNVIAGAVARAVACRDAGRLTSVVPVIVLVARVTNTKRRTQRVITDAVV